MASLADACSEKLCSPETQIYIRVFVRAGYGNFASPLLEVRYMATWSEWLHYAPASLNHQSFGKGRFLDEQSKESHTNLGIWGSYS